VKASAIDNFASRVPALEARLTEERQRYRAHSLHPFVFKFLGPVDEAEPPPKPEGETLFDSAKLAWATWRWTSRVDGNVGLDTSAYDSRIYVSARVPEDQKRMMVEGQSEQGGRIGTVEVELDDTMADFALVVTAHELFHTLGATDKYDEQGHTLFPAGLAEPGRQPLLPQAFAEVMAENRPIAPDTEVPPDSLDELAVGPATAAEIGW
jgi:hypothetical protein